MKGVSAWAVMNGSYTEQPYCLIEGICRHSADTYRKQNTVAYTYRRKRILLDVIINYQREHELFPSTVSPKTKQRYQSHC